LSIITTPMTCKRKRLSILLDACRVEHNRSVFEYISTVGN